MKKDILKKFDRKKQLMVSPLALAVSACGGGGTTNPETTSSEDEAIDASGIENQTNNFSDTTDIVHRTDEKLVPNTATKYLEFDLTGNNFIDSTTQGSKWNVPTEDTLKYAVSSGDDGTFWNNAEQVSSALEAAIGDVDYFTNLTTENLGAFSSISDAQDQGAHIILYPDTTSFTGSEYYHLYALAGFPSNDEETFPEGGHIIGNFSGILNDLPIEAFEFGGQGYFVLLHELGHALGLKHTHDDGGTNRPTFIDIGFGDFDDNLYSVMSYHDDFNNGEFDVVYGNPATFMPADALALMYLYGVNNSTNADDTTHYFYPNTARITLWDASGDDTIDLRSIETSCEIALPFINFEDGIEEEILIGYVQLDVTDSATISWLMGNMENVIGGMGDDTIFGNDSNNSLIGGEGDDYLSGYAGDDDLSGGLGADQFVLAAGSGDDMVIDFEVGVDQCVFVNSDGLIDPTAAEMKENVDGYIMFELYEGSTLTLMGITAADLLIT